MRVSVVTVSDRSFRGEREDLSGPALRDYLRERGVEVEAMEVVPDEEEDIVRVLSRFVDEDFDLVLTTGGTGLSPRDVTPEATRRVIEREIPGFSELMRRKSEEKTRFAPFSRGVCGIARRTLVVNLPGSPRGAVENLDFLFPLIPEAVRMIKGKVDDCASHRE